jgi:hypothetical protein
MPPDDPDALATAIDQARYESLSRPDARPDVDLASLDMRHVAARLLAICVPGDTSSRRTA